VQRSGKSIPVGVTSVASALSIAIRHASFDSAWGKETSCCVRAETPISLILGIPRSESYPRTSFRLRFGNSPAVSRSEAALPSRGGVLFRSGCVSFNGLQGVLSRGFLVGEASGGDASDKKRETGS
jgi:hypothetical protein